MIEMLQSTGAATNIVDWLKLLDRDYASNRRKVLANMKGLLPDGLGPGADSIMVDRHEVKLFGKVRYELVFERYQIINAEPYAEFRIVHK